MIGGLFWLIKTLIFGEQEEQELLIPVIKECYKINLEHLQEEQEQEQEQSESEQEQSESESE